MNSYLKILFSGFICLTGFSSIGQMATVQWQIDSLKYLKTNAFDCNSVYWRIIAHEKTAIPFLIVALDDTTLTKAKDKCKKTNLRVGDLAYLALTNIIPLPISAVTKIQFDVFDKNCQLFVWEYIETHRNKFERQVYDWYYSNYKTYKWVKFTNKELTECYRKNKIYGRYE